MNLNKNLIKRLLLLFYFFFIAPSSLAAVQYPYYFTSPVQQQRFEKLISELRCLVCQNQSLAESNAPLALDLKREVYHKVVAGASTAEIKTYLISRYGEYILFKPNINTNTYLLWFGPLIFLLGASSIMFLSIYRQSKITN